MGVSMARLFFAVMALAVLPGALCAQSRKDNWDNLKQLDAGHKVKVVDMDLKAWAGRLVSVSDEAITIREKRKQQEITVERANVFRVTDLQRARRGRNALIGFGTGFVVGAVYATREGREDLAPWGVAVYLVGLFGGTGAGIGALIPSYPTIYRAQRGPAEAASGKR